MADNASLSASTYGLASARPTVPDYALSKNFTGTQNGPRIAYYYATDTGVYSMYANGAWQNIGSTSSLLSIARNANLAATGTVLADAAQLSAGFTVVTAADGTVGVKLPAAPAAGTVVIVKNVDAANAVLKVWPDAAAGINAIAAHAAISLAAKVSAVFIADSTTQWYTVPLLPS